MNYNKKTEESPTNVINKWRGARGITRSEIAKACNIKYSTLCKWMSHPECFKYGILKRIYNYLEVPEDERVI